MVSFVTLTLELLYCEVAGTYLIHYNISGSVSPEVLDNNNNYPINAVTWLLGASSGGTKAPLNGAQLSSHLQVQWNLPLLVLELDL
jgi:hypothetical protein